MTNAYRKYQKEMEHLIESERRDTIGVYDANHIDAVLHALVDSDGYAKALGNSPQALRGRYEFRDGAAHVIASVWGLDMDYARGLMRTGQAWEDYQESMRECAGMEEYEIRKVIDEWRTEHSGWVYASSKEKALEIARDFQGDDVVVRRTR